MKSLLKIRESNLLQAQQENITFAEGSQDAFSLPLGLRKIDFRSKNDLETLHKSISISSVNNTSTSSFTQRIKKQKRKTFNNKNEKKLNIFIQNSDLMKNDIQILKDFIDTNNNNIVQGQLLNGLYHGKFTVQYFDGSTFIGQFRYGRRIYGQMNFANGYCYSGDFQGYDFHGKGILFYPCGKSLYATWNYSIPIQSVQISYPNGQFYFGEVDEKLRKHGTGSYIFANKHQYRGQFYHGHIMGLGAYINQQNDGLKGYWFKGQYKATKQQYIKCLNLAQQTYGSINKDSQPCSIAQFSLNNTNGNNNQINIGNILIGKFKSLEQSKV